MPVGYLPRSSSARIVKLHGRHGVGADHDAAQGVVAHVHQQHAFRTLRVHFVAAIAASSASAAASLALSFRALGTQERYSTRDGARSIAPSGSMPTTKSLPSRCWLLAAGCLQRHGFGPGRSQRRCRQAQDRLLPGGPRAHRRVGSRLSGLVGRCRHGGREPKSPGRGLERVDHTCTQRLGTHEHDPGPLQGQPPEPVGGCIHLLLRPGQQHGCRGGPAAPCAGLQHPSLLQSQR